ncbi:MAG: HEAT repeat domain-containing protein [Desulfobacterales bacterium]|nr:HEAT repeat domain-containing protein [Desulfobacterales bacterium]
MTNNTLKGRQLKKIVYQSLKRNNPDDLKPYPPRQVVNPLFSFLYSNEEIIKWRAITAMGIVVSGLANTNIESARVIMRRFLWNLNDESGGIGWGSPEALGEIMAHHQKLSDEYSNILISYIREDGNYLEHEVLQCGALWGVGRLARFRPDLVQQAEPHLIPFLTSAIRAHRGLAAWAIKPIITNLSKPFLKKLKNDTEIVTVFENNQLNRWPINQIVKSDHINVSD